MPLTCECREDGDWAFDPPDDFTVMQKRTGRCSSCGALIKAGDTILEFFCEREPRHWVEEKIYGDRVPMRAKRLCERCGGLYLSLRELGYCVSPDEDMLDLVQEYAEIAKEAR